MNLLKQLKTEIATKISKELASYTGDLNDIKTTGFVYARGTATNIPVSGHFYFLTTIAINENNIYQRATRLIADIGSMLTYERQCVSGTWTEWKQMNRLENMTSYTGDLNDLTETCIVYASSTATNIPSASFAYYLITIKRNDNFVLQIAKQLHSNSNSFVTYERQYYNGTWTEWRRTSQQNITTGTEYETGRIIDGKKEYAKRISIGTMPNATEKEVAHGLDMTKIVVNDIRGVMQAGSGYAMSFPFLNSSNQNVYFEIRPTVIRVTTTTDRSAYTGHVTIYYTKN